MENILHAKPPLPSELNQHVPRALDAIVLSMLAAQPVVRMPGAPILLRDLQRLEEGLGLGSGASAGTDEPSVPPTEPEPRLRTPDPNRFRDRAPMQDAPQFARYGEDSSATEEFQHSNRTTDREAFDYHKAMVMMERESGPERSSGSRPAMFATLALVLAVLGIGVAGFMYYSSGPGQRGIAASRMQEAPATAPGAPQASLPPAVGDGQAEQGSLGILSAPNPMPPKPLAAEPSPLAQSESLAARASEQPAERGIAATRMQEAPATAPGASRPTAPPPVAEATKQPVTAPGAPQASPPRAVGDGQAAQESLGILSAPQPMPPKPLAAEPNPLAQTESLVARASEQPVSAGAAPALPRAMQPTAKVPEHQPRGTARLILAVSPRGEIYIDGKHHGTTPPITTLDLEPGMHRIEVRSGSRKPYLTYMTVQTGDVRRLRHDFNARGAVHPPKSASWQNSNRRPVSSDGVSG
jgi:hypothetical protein